MRGFRDVTVKADWSVGRTRLGSLYTIATHEPQRIEVLSAFRSIELLRELTWTFSNKKEYIVQIGWNFVAFLVQLFNFQLQFS